MSLTRVTSADLASVSAQLSIGSQEIDDHLAAMRDMVQSLAGSDWPGAGSSVFESFRQQWNTSAANLREAVEGISGLLSSAAAAAHAAEQTAGQQTPGSA